MPTYPSSLPFPEAEEYSFSNLLGNNAVTFEHGNTRQRIRSARPQYYFNLSFILTTAQLAAWQIWATRYGYDWHTLDFTGKAFVSTTSFIPSTLRYVSDISIEPLGVKYFNASVMAETT